MRIPCWQTAFAFSLRIPLHDRHQTFLDKCWCAAESGAQGTGGGKNNPLGTAQKMEGSTNFNSAGVQNYANRRTGIEAHIMTIKAPEYSAILTELRKGNPDWAKLCSLIGNSRWGSSEKLLLQLCKQYGLVT